MYSDLDLELLEVREQTTWFKCKICGNIFHESNRRDLKPHGCLLCYGDINRKQEALEIQETMHGKRPYPE